MINPCGDSLPSLSPPPSTTSTSKSSRNGPFINSSKFEHFVWSKSSQDRLDDEEQLDRLGHCCWGRLETRPILQLLVLLNFLLDGLCSYLSLEHMFVSYIFAGCAVVSLLALCAVINGIQVEKKIMIKVTAMYAGIKAVVLMALTLTALAGFIEEQMTNDQFHASLEVKALFCLLPIFAATLGAQYRISQRIVQLYRMKDELYVISADLPIAGHDLGWKRREIRGGNALKM